MGDDNTDSSNSCCINMLGVLGVGGYWGWGVMIIPIVEIAVVLIC